MLIHISNVSSPLNSRNDLKNCLHPLSPCLRARKPCLCFSCKDCVVGKVYISPVIIWVIDLNMPLFSSFLTRALKWQNLIIFVLFFCLFEKKNRVQDECFRICYEFASYPVNINEFVLWDHAEMMALARNNLNLASTKWWASTLVLAAKRSMSPKFRIGKLISKKEGANRRDGIQTECNSGGWEVLLLNLWTCLALRASAFVSVAEQGDALPKVVTHSNGLMRQWRRLCQVSISTAHLSMIYAVYLLYHRPFCL